MALFVYISCVRCLDRYADVLYSRARPRYAYYGKLIFTITTIIRRRKGLKYMLLIYQNYYHCTIIYYHLLSFTITGLTQPRKIHPNPPVIREEIIRCAPERHGVHNQT